MFRAKKKCVVNNTFSENMFRRNSGLNVTMKILNIYEKLPKKI